MENTRSYNVGTSNYSKHKIQPWDIWLEYKLNPWDADIVKRVLRTKEGDDRKLDYEKIIHICKERIRQLTVDSPCTVTRVKSYEGKKKYKRTTDGFTHHAVVKAEFTWADLDTGNEVKQYLVDFIGGKNGKDVMVDANEFDEKYTLVED